MGRIVDRLSDTTMKSETTKKNRQYVLYIGGVLLIGGLSFWLYDTVQKKKQAQTSFTNRENRSATGFSCISDSYPLDYGTCHPDVKKLQTYLIQKGHHLGSSGSKGNGVDGQFGSLTKKAASAELGKISFEQSEINKLS